MNPEVAGIAMKTDPPGVVYDYPDVYAIALRMLRHRESGSGAPGTLLMNLP